MRGSVEELPEVLVRNLRALAGRDRRLVERLLWPAGSEHLRFEDGAPLYRYHRGFVPLEPRAPEVPAVDEVFWFGLGVGDGLREALDARPGLRVVAWERDPWLLRNALARHDWSAELATGRLQLRLGVDVLALAGTELPVVEHPVLAGVYTLERRLLARGAAGPRVGLFTGKLFVDDLAETLERRGYAPVPLDDRNWSAEELTHAVRTAGPSLLARVNLTGGLSEFGALHGLPLVVWEIDPATDTPRPPSAGSEDTHLFTYRAANVARYRDLGFRHVEYLPLAAPVGRRRPLDLPDEERARHAAPVAFVGASLVDTADELGGRLEARYAAFAGADALPEFRAGCRAVLDVQARAPGWILPELLEARYPEFLAASRADPGAEDPVALLAERAASERRLAIVDVLAPLGLHVWGDAGFEGRACYRGPARHGDELTRIYNAARVHVDVGRLYQRDIVTMRVFDVLACGGFLIAEHGPALEELFEVGREVEAWSTRGELLAKTRYYLDHPEEARAIAEAGRAAVLERHSFERRVDRLLSGVAMHATA